MTAADMLRVETQALQLLRDGYSPGQVEEKTGLTRSRLIELSRDFPGGTPRPATTTPGGPPRELPISALMAHPSNIRSDLGPIEELAVTIAEHGILQPLLVSKAPAGPWIVLDGHRRLAAARHAGLGKVPVVVHSRLADSDATIVMLVTALQKRALDPIDEAHAYDRLMRDDGYTQTEIAALVGKNPGHISQRVALLLLSPAEQEAVKSRQVGVVEAYYVARERNTRRRSGPQARPKPKRVPHFTLEHPLAQQAQERCTAAGHEVILKLGPACGSCWEHAIRDDAAVGP